MELIKTGIYEAKIINYGLGKSKKGDLQATVKFGFFEDKEPRTLTWYGGFGGKRTRFTLKTLITCGLKREVDALADGPRSGVLNTEKLVYIEVEHDDYNGKVRARIRWVNATAMGIDEVSREDAKTQLDNMGIDAELSALLNENQDMPQDCGMFPSIDPIGDVN